MLPLFSSCPFGRVFLIALSASSLLAVAGCGMSMQTAAPPVATAGVTTLVNMGDAPADRVIDFEVTVGPITLTPTSGSSVTVLSATRRIELTHLSGTNETLGLVKVPQGSYTGASITVSNPEIVFLNSLGQTIKLEPTFNQAVPVTFTPALTVGAGMPVINIDLNVANSLTFDSQGNVTGLNINTASFNLATSIVAAQADQEDENGELEDIKGTVSSVSGSSFTLTVATSGTPLTFTTDGNTQFKDGASLALLANMVVTVEGRTLADGSLYAKEVESVESGDGAEVEGLISHVTGNPATQLTFIADHGSGGGMDDSKTGAMFTIDVSKAGFKVDQSNLDTSGLGSLPSSPNFPFDAATVHSGQRVEIDSHHAIIGTSAVAETVKLQQQTLSGTVSGLTRGAPTTFTLTVVPDSAFAILAGTTTITVYWQSGTDLNSLPHTLTNDDSVRVRGLLFFTGTKSNMIARRITP